MIETFLLQPAPDRSSTIPPSNPDLKEYNEKRDSKAEEKKREGLRDSKGMGTGKVVKEKKVRLGVSEVGSSRENGCMM